MLFSKSGSGGGGVSPSLCLCLFVLFLCVQMVSIMTIWALLGSDSPHSHGSDNASQSAADWQQQQLNSAGSQSSSRQSATSSFSAPRSPMGPTSSRPELAEAPGANWQKLPDYILSQFPPAAPPLPELPAAQQNYMAEYLVSKLSSVAKQTKALTKQLQSLQHPPPTLPTSEFDYRSLLPKQCQMPGALKVGTFNLWNTNPPWDLRRERIGNMIAQIMPDILGVQEVRTLERENQLKQLAGRLSPLGYHLVYQKVHDFGGGSEEGLGVISRHPILSTSTFVLQPLPTPSNLNVPPPMNRACLHALVNTTSLGLVNFFVTHLSTTDFEQCRSVVQLLEQLNSENFDRTLPQVLVGDFNSYFDFEWPVDFLTQKSPEFALSPLNPCSRFFHDYRWPRGFAPFRDPWEVTNPTSPGHTFPTFKDARTQDAARVDRVFVRHHSSSLVSDLGTNLIECGAATFGGDEAVFMHEGKAMYPSDHAGVIASFVWDPRPDLTYGQKLKDVRNWITKSQPPAAGAPSTAAPSPSAPSPSSPGAPSTPAAPAQPTQPTPTSSSDPKPEAPPAQSEPSAAAAPDATADGVVALEAASRAGRRQWSVTTFRPATVSSSILDYEHADDREYHGPEKAFDGSTTTFFWSERAVKLGDHLTIVLNSPERFASVQAFTGHPPIAGRENEPLRDALVTGVLEVSFLQTSSTGARSVSPFKAVAQFSKGVAQASLTPFYSDSQAMVHSLRIKATAAVDSWLVIREVVLQ